MKKIFTLFLVIPAFIIFATPSLAIFEGLRGTINQKRQDLRQENKDIKQEARPTIVQDKLELRLTKAQAIIKRLRQGLTSRFESINKIKSRIEARISAIEKSNEDAAKPRDLTAAKAKLAEFNTDKYDADLTTFDAKVTEVLNSSTPLKLTSGIKTAANAIKDDLKSLHQILVDTLRLVIKSKQ
jgi:hypothetical protein